MIKLTRLNRVAFYLNPDLIEHFETTPDTVITLTTGQRFVVCEPAEEVVERVVAYRRRVLQFAYSPQASAPAVAPDVPPVAEPDAADLEK